MRKIWREPTDEEVKADVERLLSRLTIRPGDFQHIGRLMEARDMFEPILLPDGSLPESMRLSRAKDYQECFDEIDRLYPDPERFK